MRALVDTDVLLDVALKREPFFQDSAAVIRWAQNEPGQIGVAWHSLANLAYLVHPARDFISDLLHFIEVAPTGTREARHALTLPMGDLEDALQAVSGYAFDAMFIVTRNVKDYRKSPIPPITPAKFLAEVGRG